MKKPESNTSQTIYMDLFNSVNKYARYAYFTNNDNYREEIISTILESKNKIESKFDSLRKYNEDYSSLIMFLTNHIFYFHEFLSFAYKNILLDIPEFELKKNEDMQSVDFIVGRNKFFVSTSKTKIKNPNPGNIAFSMIYENKNSDLLEKKEIKITNIESKQLLTEITIYTPFVLDNVLEEERIQLEIIVENVIYYINSEMDKILNHILHLYTNNNLDWKVVINNGLWIRNSEPKKRYFKRSTHR